MNLQIGDFIYKADSMSDAGDYFEQQITKVNEDTVEVFESGYSPNGKHFTVEKKHLHKKDNYIVYN